MSDFFKTHILEQIKKNESDPVQIDNFISVKECSFLLEYFRNLRNKSVGKSIFVEREESTKIFFKLDQIPEIAKLYEKIKKEIGEFYVNDFQPHLITSRYPLRLHVDTGKNPNDLIYKNVIVPLEIEYDKSKDHHEPPNTLIFKNKWYEKSALFTHHTNSDKDFIIKDSSGNFVDILNIDEFYHNIKELDDIDTNFEGSNFHISEKFKDYIKRLTEIKRYNLRTNKHIVNDRDFDKNLYKKYLTHQKYKDCKSLILDRAIETKIGSLIYWDRTRIHSSDNFIKNNVKSKTLLAFFTSKTKIEN
tara:strand:- start:1273 stop:2181 length:909 start_codon:yes stop_codon:yes gene_type:complete